MRLRYIIFLNIISTFSTLALPLAQASKSPLTEIRVSLFGQPCVLQGPLDEKSLRAIHSLSPEQLYPSLEGALSAAPIRRALEKLRNATGLPSSLDRYRDRLAKRFEAQVEFLEALETAKKTTQSTALSTALKAVAKKHLSAKRFQEFESQMKTALRSRDSSDVLFETFNEGIEADPEDEFHKTIHRMNIQYTCTFEDLSEEAK
jgi:hypothetical protein